MGSKWMSVAGQMTGDQRAVAWAVLRPLATAAWGGFGALLVVTLPLVLLTGSPELALAMAVPLSHDGRLCRSA